MFFVQAGLRINYNFEKKRSFFPNLKNQLPLFSHYLPHKNLNFFLVVTSIKEMLGTNTVLRHDLTTLKKKKRYTKKVWAFCCHLESPQNCHLIYRISFFYWIKPFLIADNFLLQNDIDVDFCCITSVNGR